jgi:alkylation response protein AidB-like acyl-CoA dehydrogenase
MSELLGAAEEALRMSIEYAQIRVQFGSPIGSYQAVKHILADMAVDVAVSSSLVDSAIVAVDSVPLSLAAYARIEQAKAHVAQAVVRVLENALQVHGGIGYTSEYRLSLLFHRVLALRALWGDPDKCALRLGAKRMGRQ